MNILVDIEISDTDAIAITLRTLKSYRKTLKDDLKRFKKSEFILADEVKDTTVQLTAINTVITEFKLLHKYCE